MTDLIDDAQAYDAMNLQQALEVQAAKAKATPHPKARGYCLNPDCEIVFFGNAPGRLYCGPACADAHDKHERLRKQATR